MSGVTDDGRLGDGQVDVWRNSWLSSTLSSWVPGMSVGVGGFRTASRAGHRMMVATNWPELETSTPPLQCPSCDRPGSPRGPSPARCPGDVGGRDTGLLPKPLPLMVMVSLGSTVGLADVQLSAADGDLAVLGDTASWHTLAVAPTGRRCAARLQAAGDLEGYRTGTVVLIPFIDVSSMKLRSRCPAGNLQHVLNVRRSFEKSWANTLTVSPVLAELGTTLMEGSRLKSSTSV